MKVNRIYLSDYRPKSELVVKEHPVIRPKYPVIDVHTHFEAQVLKTDSGAGVGIGEIVNRLKEHGVKQVVNLVGDHRTDMRRMLDMTKEYEDFMITFGTLDLAGLYEYSFDTYVRNTLKDFYSKGITGVKFFKDVSLKIKDFMGKYIAIDDQRLKVIWDTAAELGMPVLVHIADPAAFFKPVDRYNERYEELQEHPDWSFYEPGFYTFKQLLHMQENLLYNNPHTTFIIPHGGSYSENLSYVSECLDKYPNMYIDIAARLAEFGRQPYSSRDFFIKHQDRILFGTDGSPIAQDYPNYYRFLETFDEYFDYYPSEVPRQGRWGIYGIGLEDEVLRKIYYKNAQKVLKLQ